MTICNHQRRAIGWRRALLCAISVLATQCVAAPAPTPTAVVITKPTSVVRIPSVTPVPELERVQAQQTATAKSIAATPTAATAATAQASATPHLATGISNMKIDDSDDYRALGYPDQRKISRDSKGALYVAYRRAYAQTSKTAEHIFVAKSTDNGGSWVVVNHGKPIETVGDFNQRVPAIAIDARDVLHVVWYGNDGQNTGANERQIKYTQSTDGGETWLEWVRVAQVNGYTGETLWQEHPVIAAAGGVLYVAWQGRDAASAYASRIKFSRSTDGGRTWSAVVDIAPTRSGGHSRPTLLAGTTGDHLYVLAYGDWQGRQQILWTDSTDQGGKWGAWRAVASSANDQRHVTADVDALGNLHAAWREDAAGKTDAIYYAAFENGAWKAAQPVSSDTQLHDFFPSLAVSGADVWIVWTATPNPANAPEDDPVDGMIYYARLSQGGWSQAAIYKPASLHAIYAGVGIGINNKPGGVDMVWLDNAADVKSLRYGRLSIP